MCEKASRQEVTVQCALFLPWRRSVVAVEVPVSGVSVAAYQGKFGYLHPGGYAQV